MINKQEIEKAIIELEYQEYNPLSQNTRNFSISALEKQIPKKPELVPEPYDDGIEQITRYIDLPYCPNCGDLMVDFTGHKHCTNCGQAIDWSGDDE